MIRKLVLLGLCVLLSQGCAYLTCKRFIGKAKDLKATVKAVPAELGKGDICLEYCSEWYILKGYKKKDDLKFGDIVPVVSSLD